MTKLTFVSQSDRHSDDVGYTPERLVNFYSVPGAGKSPFLLRSVLGQSAFADSSIGFVRAMDTVNGVIYAVASGSLYSITSGGAVSTIGTIADDPTTTISENGDKVTIAAGGNYYVWDGSALTQPSGGAFTNEGTVSFINGRTIITEDDGDKFEWTDINDPETRDALNFATAETVNDNTLRVIADRRELWLFNERSIEVWYSTGQGGANEFAQLNGGALDTGVLAASLISKSDEGIFFIGDDRIAYITAGLGLRPISTPAVNTAVAESTPTNCFYYEDRGHKFFCIRFSDRPAWCFDLTTGLWHERSSGSELGAWDVVATTKLGQTWYCGTSGGEILAMSRVNQDVSLPLRRVAVSRSLYMDGEQFSVRELEFLAKIGESDLGRDAHMMLRISKDAGRTWSEEMTHSLGDLGDRTVRAVFRALGRQRDFSVEIAITDPTDLNFYADVNVRIG